MTIYTIIISGVLAVSFILNCILIQMVNRMIKENEYLDDEIKSKG